MDKSREQFEAWVKSDIDRVLTMQCPIYKGVAFSAWQASRAVEIDFTNAYIVCEGENTYSSIDINDVYKLITEAGYKFKER